MNRNSRPIFNTQPKQLNYFIYKIIHIQLCKMYPVLWCVFTYCYCSNRSTLQILYASFPLLFTEWLKELVDIFINSKPQC